MSEATLKVIRRGRRYRRLRYSSNIDHIYTHTHARARARTRTHTHTKYNFVPRRQQMPSNPKTEENFSVHSRNKETKLDKIPNYLWNLLRVVLLRGQRYEVILICHAAPALGFILREGTHNTFINLYKEINLY